MLYQNLVQGQHLKIFPQQLQMLQLFHLNTIELDQRIRSELEENPLIEENPEADGIEESSYEAVKDVGDYKDWDEYDDYYSRPSKSSKMDVLLTKCSAESYRMGVSADFRAEAKQQLCFLNLTPEEQHVGEFIIYSLTDEGFLEDTADSLTDNYMLKYTKLVHPEMMDKMIHLIRTFDPVGLASTSIRECLLAQLARMDKQERIVRLGTKILEDHYDTLKSGDLEECSGKLKIDDSELHRILGFLGSLKLKPVPDDSEEMTKAQIIIPDFIISYREDGRLDISLYREKSASLRVNNQMKSRIDRMKDRGGNKTTGRELAKKLTAAEWFVNAIKERESVMLQVMKVIVDIQYEYFLSGDELQISPMILKDVAEQVGVDISTVSRVTSNKYVQMPFGCVPLKKLFNEGIANSDGEMVNVKKVQEAMKKLIHLENKDNPYTDSQLARLLSDNGLKISRRTVTKYRNEIQIPPVKLRQHSVSL